MKQTSVSLPHAILFVTDLTNESITVPEYETGVLAAATDSCVSVATRAEVDGDVTVSLSDHLSPHEKLDCIEVFTGVLETPGKKVAVVTSGLKVILEMPVRGLSVDLSIRVDDAEAPTSVWIEAASS